MAHDGQRKQQKSPLIGRIQPMEVFLLTMGIALLVYGITNSQSGVIFFGLVTIPGVLLLHKVRQKDWAKHWEEMEAEHKARAEFDAHRTAVTKEARNAVDGK
ncbi:MAG: hypothetical protein PHY09_02555 [Desulfuromonadaceae bacterium]|nr:hypothetical protein [Desulfuromonadaceae bacterium]MDD5105519.1 hypothetical protein [Desulfuromonadaceae bacterium]